jgi:hypothetical protein
VGGFLSNINCSISITGTVSPSPFASVFTGSWGHFDMTVATGAPPAIGDPMGYVGVVPRVVYRGQDNHIHEIAIYPESGSWGHFDMTAATGAPPAIGEPKGYLGVVPRVVYRGLGQHVHEIAFYA